MGEVTKVAGIIIIIIIMHALKKGQFSEFAEGGEFGIQRTTYVK
jgi:hypothetical protein